MANTALGGNSISSAVNPTAKKVASSSAARSVDALDEKFHTLAANSIPSKSSFEIFKQQTVVEGLSGSVSQSSGGGGSRDPVEGVIEILTRATFAEAYGTLFVWKNFFPTLVTKFHDGMILLSSDTTTIQFQKFFYPKW